MSDLLSEEVTTHPLDGTEPNGTSTNKDVLDNLFKDGEIDPLTKLMAEKEAKEKAQKEKEEKIKKATEGMFSLNADLGKFLDMKEKLGSATEVNEFLKARGVLEKMRTDAETKVKDGELSLGTIADATGTGAGKKPTDAEKAAALLEKQKLDLSLTDRSKFEVVAADRPAGFGPKYVEIGPWDAVSDKADNPVTLKTEEWTTLLAINKAFHGFTIREEQKDIVKARRPAFVLDGPDLSQIKPEFEVFDSSSIQIKEAKTDLQRSLAENGFSSHSVQASASGGAFGVSAGISSGLFTSSSTGLATTDIEAQTEYFATYNFPRARVFMDEYSLKVSKECALVLDGLNKKYNREFRTYTEAELDAAEAELRTFSAQYGHVFATTFQLGGQLQSSKFASSLFSSKESDQRDALKASVAMSFSSTYASGSASYSNENQSHENEKERKISDLATLAWTARGGNSLLCANPPRWAGSVGTWTNWRVIEQEEVVPLYDLFGRFKEWEKIPILFKNIAQRRLEAQAVENNTWKGKIKLLIDGKRLGYNENDTDTLVVTAQPSGTGPREPVFTVLSGIITAKDKKLNNLPVDYPLILVTGDKYAPEKSKNYQIPGMWVNPSGRLKPETSTVGSYICRWSFRRTTSSGRWTPNQPDSEIKDGDQVNLFCHSIGLGSYVDYDRPPSYASRVKYHAGADQLVCHGFGDPLDGEWNQAHLFDEGKLTTEQVADTYSDDEKHATLLNMGGMLNLDAIRLVNEEKRYWDGGWRGALFTVQYVYETDIAA
ncbi:hypothetical protein LTR84_005415 [Exophiala bonariae]|uniref:MACPF-like domain-containing protein n=1 Tax=Exophiala bonariae TaxID=1690606 RepID=A0AAV9N429_9EURO|nr:hypothetical protein LTR84_005415 [Exophiala bonariae]